MSTTPAAACPLLRCLAVLSEELWRENLALAEDAQQEGQGEQKAVPQQSGSYLISNFCNVTFMEVQPFFRSTSALNNKAILM